MRGLNVRVLLIATLPALLIALLLSSYFTYSRFSALERSISDRGIAIARQLAPSAEFGVFTGNREVLNRLVIAVASENDVTAVTIRDVEGKVLAHSGELAITKVHELTARTPMQSEEDTGQTLLSSSPIFQSKVKLETFFDVTVSKDASTTTTARAVLGRVYVAMSRAALAAKQTQVLFEILVITLLIFAANLFLAVRLSGNLSRPLVRLTQAVEKIAAGALDTRVVPDSDGAIRALEDGVNSMAVALHSAQADLEHRITDATTQLEQKKEEAERANLAKSRFLATASHDLRQPVHALGLFVSSLQNKPLSEEAHHVAGQIERSVLALQDLLEALLDISRLDAGTVTANIEDFAINPMMQSLFANITPTVNEKGLALRMVPCSAVVRSDPILLERILVNFLSNAARYTDRGKILLGCRRLRTGLRIEVWDTGVGIAEDQQHEIFAEFYRLPGSQKNSAKGLGLGLAIVDRLARLLGHQISVKSQPGVRSVFAVIVPYGTELNREQQVLIPQHRDTADLENPIVMVIDDDTSALAATKSLLESWDCIVLTAESGSEAESLALEFEQAPDLVICDYRLSQNETAIEVIERLRSIFGKNIAVIIISADTTSETARRVEHSGHLLLHKPLRPAKLRALALYLLHRERQ